MTLIILGLVLVAVIVGIVIMILSENKRRIIEAKQNPLLLDETRVYDGIPITKCRLCGGRGVVIHKIKGKDILFNIRCRDCSRTLFKDDGWSDLGYVMNEWNNWNDTKDDVRSYCYDYIDNSGKGKNGWKMSPPQITRY